MNKPQTDKMEMIDLEQLSREADFNSAIDRDFGAALEGHTDGVSRRRWLQLMGASLALGGAVGCRYEEEKIAPFAFRPQNRVPGVPEKFATMIDFAGVAQPLVSTNYDGRPIKLDGNPEHPCSLGASSAFTQAQILEFYDPDRLRVCLKANGQTSKFGRLFDESAFDAIVAAFRPLLAGKDLSKVAVLAQPASSPTLQRLQEEFVSRGGSWVTYSSVADDNTRAGVKAAFGEPLRARYHFDKAKVIVTLDADPLMLDAGAISNSITFAKGRDADSGSMSRLYAVESQFSTTGAAADHRISVRSSDMPGFVASLAAAIESAKPGEAIDRKLPYRERLLLAMAQDLKGAEGASIIVPGELQSPEVHALVHSLNEKLGNHGKTIEFTSISDSGRSVLQAIQDLSDQIKGGGIETLVVIGGNPVYDAPRSLGFADLIGKLKNSLHLTLYKNETSLHCGWVSNLTHPLETWKDGYAFDGSMLLGQPLINPLFGGKSEIETLAMLMGGEVVDGQQLLRETLGAEFGDARWRQAVHDGFVEATVAPPVEVKAEPAPKITASDAWSKPWDGKSLEVVFNPSRSVYDGRFANNAWLQELPDFFTKVAWDNVASVSPKTSETLGLKHGTVATIRVNGAEQKIPVYVQAGQANGSIGIEIGYGRTAAGRVGGDLAAGVETVGFDVNDLRAIENWQVVGGLGSDAVVGSRTKHSKLAVVQEPWVMDSVGRNEIQARMFRDRAKKETDRSGLLREGSLESYREFLKEHPIGSHEGHSHDGHSHDGHSHEGHSHADQTNTAVPASGQQSLSGLDDSKSGDSKISPVVAKLGALPIINPVAYVPDDAHKSLDDGLEHPDDHGHHAPQWPEAFHMHHALFDLTPGSRRDYTATNPEYKNMWGMSIDLNKCIGCSSCMVACQSENNVPVVGKADVWRGREMHWIRIDRYFGDNLYTEDAADDDKVVVMQPLTCHHCENAPCETVCPVAATVHSSEGLNDMVYNRCIGTRYCGNNCPYKVRRFNYFNYTDAVTLLKYPGDEKMAAGDRKLQNLMMNPEVTVRSRGVMEKCTYCVQRIQNTKIQAKNEHREIGANEIVVACQEACPTSAIKFGDLNHADSDVAKAHANPRSYVMLEELNNRPRTKYLAKVRNPHPALIDFDDRSSVPKKRGAAH